MSLSSLRWRTATALPVLALLLGAAPGASKGISYDFSMVTTNDNGKGKDMTMAGKGMVAGGNARIEFTDVTMPQMRAQGGPFAEGSYILFKSATKEFIVVDTKQKQYSSMDQDQLMSLTSALTNIVKVEMTNVHVDADRVQPDSTIDSYKTQHYRMTEQYHMKMSVAFIHSENDVSSVLDYYYAPQFDDLINPYMSNGWSSSSNFFNNADYMNQLKAATAKLHHGVPVLMVMHSTTTDKKGKATSGTTVMHTTNLVRADIPASTFEIPAGYTKYEPPQAAPAQNSSAQPDTAKKKKKGLFHIPR